jgi:hypothetical protein
MSYGLQVWNSSGNLTLNTSDRLPAFISNHSFTLPSASLTVFVSVPVVVVGQYFAFCTTNANIRTETVTGGFNVGTWGPHSAISGQITVFRL